MYQKLLIYEFFQMSLRKRRYKVGSDDEESNNGSVKIMALSPSEPVSILHLNQSHFAVTEGRYFEAMKRVLKPFVEAGNYDEEVGFLG